ncbi:hypothetical protein GCM10007108_15400 [Thermogymnomonas acidicola]|uniref:OsmC family peroxiredoxin n=1 Tax=Thermogymnomonas acidicola TaxID=399579 RepID=A0AA37BSS8_9ARCH|nr:OsmC family protein [Thermogymnomonas acidicola]GGM78144.1 hypothetical protein GCM10007108_15400 [Thermogymnomonas acidicola]
MRVSFTATERGFLTTTEGKEQIHIKNSVSNNLQDHSPTELLMLAMGGCTSDDVLSMLGKMRQNVRTYRCVVDGEREESIPKVLKSANIHYIIEGEVEPEKALRAINLSLSKYCSVSILAKRGGTRVTYSLTVNGKVIAEREKAPLEGSISPEVSNP